MIDLLFSSSGFSEPGMSLQLGGMFSSLEREFKICNYSARVCGGVVFGGLTPENHTSITLGLSSYQNLTTRLMVRAVNDFVNHNGPAEHFEERFPVIDPRGAIS